MGKVGCLDVLFLLRDKFSRVFHTTCFGGNYCGEVGRQTLVSPQYDFDVENPVNESRITRHLRYFANGCFAGDCRETHRRWAEFL